MNDKCKVCKCYVEDGNCPCHFNNDDELCDFSFELINMSEHDKQIRADAIKEYKQSDEYIKECVQRYLKGKADAIAELKPYVLTNADGKQFLWLTVDELNKLSFAEQLKEQSNDSSRID